MKEKRIVFIGSLTPLRRVLRALPHMAGLEYIAAYYTSEYVSFKDDKVISVLLKGLNLKVFDINVLKTKSGEEQLKAQSPDWIFSIISDLILPDSIITIPKEGSLNLHPGKLPEYAGLNVNQWAIRNDEKRFAATLHWIDSNTDTGPIAYMKEFPITEEDTGLSVFTKCIIFGVDLVIEALRDISQGRYPPKIEQDMSKRKVYLKKDSNDGNISWFWTSRQIFNFVRAVDYYPFQSPSYVPFLELFNGQKVIVRKVKALQQASSNPGEVISITEEGLIVGSGDGLSVLINEVQLEDKTVVKGARVAESLYIKKGYKFII